MLMTTGRDLDVAVDGPGWIAVQDPNGAEAYTRMGNLQLNAAGNLQTSTGLNVVDDAGRPIVLPLPMEKIEINRDGTISGRPEELFAANLPGGFPAHQAGQPGGDAVEKGRDGLFRRKGWPAGGRVCRGGPDRRLLEGEQRQRGRRDDQPHSPATSV